MSGFLTGNFQSCFFLFFFCFEGENENRVIKEGRLPDSYCWDEIKSVSIKN